MTKAVLMTVLLLALLKDDMVETEKEMEGVSALPIVVVVVLWLEAPCGPSPPIKITITIFESELFF